MLFNSYVFILGFFPVALILYFLLNRIGRQKAAQIVLIGLSLVFYAYFHVWYLLVIVGSIVVNYGLSRYIITHKNRAKVSVAIGIVLNISVIFYFKYYNFFIENINLFRKSPIPLLQVLMPLGISFFTFQQISYLVDSYREETRDYGFIEYALFVSFFPQLIAGPIVFHDEMISQFRDPVKKNFNQENFASGLYLFAIGLAKKVLIADTLSKGVDFGYANADQIGGLTVVLVAVFYSFQLYFDFSGYCDMAYGIAKCFNFELPVNFLSPYKATSISDFWKRWHITLTRFLTKYVYIPLGGSRKGKTRTLINVMLVFLISGLWHGANWTFVFWGFLHGLASVLYRLFGTIWDKIWKPVKVVCTFVFVTIAWIPFRAPDLQTALKLWTGVFHPSSSGIFTEFCKQYAVYELTYLEDHIGLLRNLTGVVPSLYMWLLMTLSAGLVFLGKNRYEKKFYPTPWNAAATVVLLLWTILSLSGVSIFLYFNF